MRLQFRAKCECKKEVDFTDTLVLYKLVTGVADNELQKKLLTKADLTLAEVEKMAVATESAKSSQVAMSGDSNSGIRSSYKQETKKGDTPTPCRSCGSPKPHKDRKKDCPAWKSTCTCGIGHHYHHLCSRKGIPPPPRAAADKEQKKSKVEEHGSVQHRSEEYNF